MAEARVSPRGSTARRRRAVLGALARLAVLSLRVTSHVIYCNFRGSSVRVL